MRKFILDSCHNSPGFTASDRGGASNRLTPLFEKKEWDTSWGNVENWKPLMEAKHTGSKTDKRWDPAWDNADFWKDIKQKYCTKSVIICHDDCQCGLAPPDSLHRAKSFTGRPLKILCLHGGNSSSEGFEVQLEELSHQLGGLVEFTFAQAPNGESANQFLWMGDAAKHGPHSVGWWQDSKRHVETILEEQGPFSGVLGYSMGSAASFSLLAALPEGTFQFAVLCCGYVPTNNQEIMEQLDERRPLRTPVMHCFGRSDGCIPAAYTGPMLDYFAPEVNSVMRHPGGHDVPRDTRHIQQLAAFLLRFAA